MNSQNLTNRVKVSLAKRPTRRQHLFLTGIVLFCLTLFACGETPQSAEKPERQTGSHVITLIAPDEPGQPLTIYGEVVDALTNESIPDVRVYLYHADANGEYLPTDPGDESTAKLSGEVMTGNNGQFTVHTIVPREYDQPGNRHIHLHYVRADGYEQAGGVILFEDDVNDEIRQWANETGFGTIIELAERDGVMEGNLIIQLEPEKE